MRIFEVTAQNDRIKVRAGESSTLELTVTNTTDRKLNRLVRIVPENTDHSDWISIHGDSGKNFAPGGTQKITIKFSPPVKTSPGKSKCRVLVAEERDSDENFTDITLEYEIKEPKEIPKRKILPWILAACGDVVIIAGVIWFVTRDKEIPVVPDVVKLHDINKAFREAERVGLEPLFQIIPKSGGIAGNFKKQDPVAGSPIPEDNILNVYIFDGQKSGGSIKIYPLAPLDRNAAYKQVMKLRQVPKNTSINQVMKLKQVPK